MSLDTRLIENILSQPTAPYREYQVQQAIIKELNASSVPYFKDPLGNLIVGVGSKTDYLKLLAKKTAEALRIFIAHTDHPGFHGLRWLDDRRLVVQWLGYSPATLVEGALVYLADAQGYCGEAKIREAHSQSGAHGRTRLTGAVVELTGPLQRKASATDLFGAFKFKAPVWLDQSLIHSQAADDLIGVCAVLTLAKEHFQKRKAGAPHFIGLFTRAEEVGLLGAIGHFELGWHKKSRRPLLAVSLETSRQLIPGAEIGKGPVVRQGDRFTTFSAAQTFLFAELAARELPGRHQKKVMDGGQCEASVAMVYGIPTIAISVPLGNYHNHPFEVTTGAAVPSAEFVHATDFEGMIELCRLAIRPKMDWLNPYKNTLKEFKKSFRAAKKNFYSGP